MIKSLLQIREHDRNNRNSIIEISSEEGQLIEYLQNSIKDGFPVNQEEILAKAEKLINSRKEVINSMNEQIKISQKIYEEIGIAYFDKL